MICCRNGRGKFAKGRKVTGIEFLNVNFAMVTTNDSRIRFIDIQNGKIIYKIKGHKNETFPVRASMSEDLSHVVCGSEDGEVYLWSQIQSTVVTMSKKGLFGKLMSADKSDVCEYFTPTRGSTQPVTAAVLANSKVVLMQMKKNERMLKQFGSKASQ